MGIAGADEHTTEAKTIAAKDAFGLFGIDDQFCCAVCNSGLRDRGPQEHETFQYRRLR